jgi:hypothetical protein
MDKHRLSKRLLEIKMTAKRPRGRPWTQQLDQVKTDRKKRMISGEGWKNTIVDRQRQLETPFQKLTRENGNNIRKRKKKDRKTFMQILGCL